MKVLVLVALATVALEGAASAGDGRIEINQAAATAAGGFPYTIGQPGSYLLTSDLVVGVANTSGIVISASPVTLDLNGFSVRGPGSCTRPQASFYDAKTITCTATDNGYGITGGTGNTIRNGAVKGFGRYGVFAGGDLTAHTIIEDMRVEQNAQGGIYFSNGSVRRVNVTLNGGAEIFTVAGGDSSTATMIDDCNVAFNKGNGLGVASKVRNCRIGYNGGAGLIHTNAGGQNSSVSDSQIYRNGGKAIDAYGSYRDNEILSNESVGGQVIGGMSDEGGNNVH